MSETLHTQPIDPALIAAVARKVITRLRAAQADASTSTNNSANSEIATPERLITIETLRKFQDDSRIAVTPGTVVTPAAKDEARRRGIAIKRLNQSGTTEQTSSNTQVDQTPDNALTQQLVRRGVTMPTCVELSWTETPAKDVFEYCRQGKRAAMVTSLADVDRFASELSPKCWVLDKQKLNLIAAVNVAARIAKHSQGLSR